MSESFNFRTVFKIDYKLSLIYLAIKLTVRLGFGLAWFVERLATVTRGVEGSTSQSFLLKVKKMALDRFNKVTKYLSL